LLRRTLTEKIRQKKDRATCFLNPISVLKALGEKFSGYWVTPLTVATSWTERHSSLQNGSKGRPTMTISTRVALGISAAALSLSLALAPVAFAQDKMSKDDGMKKDAMSKDDGMKKDAMKKDDAMSKDAMKKDDGMKKDEMKK
jgi:pentapeptide MXKDX repeat protein